MNKSGEKEWQRTLAVNHVLSAFSNRDENGEKVENDDPSLFEDPAYFLCWKTGTWKLVDMDGKQIDPEFEEKFLVDRAAFDTQDGDLKSLINHAEKLYRSGKMLEAEIEGLGRPEHGKGCWVRTTGSFLGSNSCLCRAREGKLTCMAHDDFEEAAHFFKDALEKTCEPHGYYEEILRLDEKLSNEWIDLCIQQIESVAGPEFRSMERTELWWHNFRKWADKDYYLCPIQDLEDDYGKKDTVAVVFVGQGVSEFEVGSHEICDITSLKRRIWEKVGCQENLENLGEWYLETVQEDIKNGLISVFPS
jgi:hypothetical protein